MHRSRERRGVTQINGGTIRAAVFSERMGCMEKLELLRQWVEESKRIVFFGGAGVSTESGIKDFRSVDGLYRQKFEYKFRASKNTAIEIIYLRFLRFLVPFG